MLGTYRILSPLGAGGMGEVYVGRDTRLERDVAIKVLHFDTSSSSDRIARLEQEARTVAAFNHPNIVTLYSIEEEDGTRFLTMELVEGQSLERLLRPQGLPLARILQVAGPLADAVATAHERGVVHRDLKPTNIMVTPDGRVKVLDFGLATPVPTARAGAGVAEVTRTQASHAHEMAGTLPYMAPEQVRGEPVDARTDLFALGVVLYEMATGQRPFRGATDPDVVTAILRDTPPDVESLRQDLPPALARAIGSCLEKDRAHRIATAREVASVIRNLQMSLTPGAFHGPSGTPEPDRSPRGIPSIAVLPFVNRSRNEEEEYFADGLADAIVNVLAKVRGLRVAAATSSFLFKRRDENVSAIGRRLNVATILDGSVRTVGDRLRVSVQLVNAADGFHLWSQMYDRTLDDVFAVQDDIAESVVAELRSALLEGDAASGDSDARADLAAAKRGRGAIPEAQRLYLRARHLGGLGSAEHVETGIRYAREAIDLDPGNALAWAWLSRAYLVKVGRGSRSREEGTALARKAAEQALRLEPDLPEAHLALSFYFGRHMWDWSAAAAATRKALELAPGSAEVLRAASQLARIQGQTGDAVTLGERAVELDPLSPTTHVTLGNAYRAVRRPREAEASYRTVLEIAPTRPVVHGLIALALVDQGRLVEARTEASREMSGEIRLMSQAVVAWLEGRPEDSDRALSQLIAEYGHDSGYQVAQAVAARRDPDRVFEWLEQAADQRDAGLADLLVEPLFDFVHEDPRWDALLRRIGLR